jgi:hypothetical protein
MDSYNKLQKLYQTIDSLSKTPTTEKFDEFGALFSDNCTAYLASMREYDEPSIGRQAVITDQKAILHQYHVHKRRVLSHSTTSDGLTVFCEMKNSLHIFGQVLDPFYETAVVVFNEQGLITELKQYSCRSHIMEVIQDQTGVGSYSKLEGTKATAMESAACCQ